MAVKFVWYIIDLNNQAVYGTNDMDVLEPFMDDEDYWIMHQGGAFFNGDREEKAIAPINEMEGYEAPEEDNDD